jgi:LmbE family N-acetylglucosaminyl deacetylase
MKKLLFITAHYDDMEICAGGTAARYGGTSVVLYAKDMKGTKAEAEAAAQSLGVAMVEPEHYEGERKLVRELDLLAAYHDVIIASSPWDSHPEHRKAADIARQLARRGKALWFMDHAIPGGSPTGPRPNHFVTLYDTFKKRDAIFCYNVISTKEYGAASMRDAYYGWINGVPAAESFYIEHSIQ